jgi:TolA-binding protein
MSNKHNQEVDTNIESLSKAETFIKKNNKKIVAGVIAVAAVLIAIFSVRSCNEKKAAEAKEAFTAVEAAGLMSIDSLSNAAALAEYEAYLNEWGDHAVGAASFEAGIAAFEAKDYNKAIEFFTNYEGEDAIYNARALACIADCYVELGNYEKAYENYAAAVAKADNEFASEYAFRAGLVAEKLGKNDKALAMYQTIKDKYPATPRAVEIEKYISRVEAK